MPSTIQIVVTQKDANNQVSVTVNDVFETQFGRHSTASIDVENTFVKFPWPDTGETALYMKFPILESGPYGINVINDLAIANPPTYVITGVGTGFVPVLIPKPPPAASGQGEIYFAILSTVVIPILPMYYF
jgi:hypothetical protein